MRNLRLIRPLPRTTTDMAAIRRLLRNGGIRLVKPWRDQMFIFYKLTLKWTYGGHVTLFHLLSQKGQIGVPPVKLRNYRPILDTTMVLKFYTKLSTYTRCFCFFFWTISRAYFSHLWKYLALELVFSNNSLTLSPNLRYSS